MRSAVSISALAMISLPSAVMAQGNPHPLNVNVVNGAASPVPVIVQGGDGPVLVEYRIVGYTTTAVNGAPSAPGGLFGVPAMHALCAAEVAPNSRVAFTVEAARPGPVTAVPLAWVLPTTLELVDDSGDFGDLWFIYEPPFIHTVVGLDDSAGAVVQQAECEARTSGSVAERGAAFSPSFGMVFASCDTVLPIACSAPVAVPVSP